MCEKLSTEEGKCGKKYTKTNVFLKHLISNMKRFLKVFLDIPVEDSLKRQLKKEKIKKLVISNDDLYLLLLL